jgi:fibrillarin-like pre-rRNA processing protein
MNPGSIRQHSHSGIYTDGHDLYTLSLVGTDVGAGRPVKEEGGTPYRPFPPGDTKLAALVKRQPRNWPFDEDTRVLYLGAGAGTTASYLSDICHRGQIFAVEFAPEPFMRLVEVARGRPNVVPIMADARDPAAYAVQVGPPVDVVYQDVAQRDQWDIARRNAEALLSPGGWVVLVCKAKSIDVALPAREVFEHVRAQAEAAGYRVDEEVDLEPFDREHAVLMIRSDVHRLGK